MTCGLCNGSPFLGFIYHLSAQALKAEPLPKMEVGLNFIQLAVSPQQNT
jgi:hypothetical protein